MLKISVLRPLYCIVRSLTLLSMYLKFNTPEYSIVVKLAMHFYSSLSSVMLNSDTKVRIGWPLFTKIIPTNKSRLIFTRIRVYSLNIFTNVLNSYNVSSTVLLFLEQEKQQSLTLEAYILVVGDTRKKKFRLWWVL